MRRALAAALAVAVVMVAPGCGGRPTRVRATTAAPTRDPALARDCAAATAIITDATARFTGQLREAVEAGERGDVAARDAAIDLVRTTFAGWSARLRTQAGRTGAAELRAVLVEYAGAVDATIARVEGPADLDRLSTFDDQELDVAASRLAGVCG